MNQHLRGLRSKRDTLSLLPDDTKHYPSSMMLHPSCERSEAAKASTIHVGEETDREGGETLCKQSILITSLSLRTNFVPSSSSKIVNNKSGSNDRNDRN